MRPRKHLSAGNATATAGATDCVHRKQGIQPAIPGHHHFATLVVAGLIVSCGQAAKDAATDPEGGEPPTSKAAAKKKPPAPQVPRCAYPKDDGHCWTSTQVLPSYRHVPTVDKWGEVFEPEVVPTILRPRTFYPPIFTTM